MKLSYREGLVHVRTLRCAGRGCFPWSGRLRLFRVRLLGSCWRNLIALRVAQYSCPANDGLQHCNPGLIDGSAATKARMGQELTVARGRVRRDSHCALLV